MKKKEVLDQLVARGGGTIRVSDIDAAGVSKTYFYDYVRRYELRKAGHGIYQTADAWDDPFVLLQSRCSQAIFSHDTALFFHDLTDREPLHLSVTVKTGYNPHRLKSSGIIVYSIKKELHDLGVINAKTPYGNVVKVYDRERTICDMIRSRGKLETDTVLTAIKQYTGQKEKDINKLLKYAKALHVENIVRNYLEVLL